jgi:Homeodomain-like domain
MSDDPARKPMGREGGRANVRASYVSLLEATGEARAEALREADGHLDRIARLLRDALSVGLSVTDVARITGVSRPTLYQLRARYGKSHTELRLAVLQAVSSGHQSLKDIVRALGRPEADLWPILTDFVDAGAFVLDPFENEEGTQAAFFLTDKGELILDVLLMEEDADTEGRPQ